MNDDRATQGWWSTLPGILTASATAITAIGGLIAILGQTGLFHTSAPATPSTPASSAASSPAVTAASIPTPVAAPVQTPVPAQTPAQPQTLAQPSAHPMSPDAESNLAYFTGSWANVDQATNGITRIQIRIADSSTYVHAWAKCRPTDCDWGEVKAEGYGSNVGSHSIPGVRVVTAEFKNSVRQTALSIHPAPNNRMRVEAEVNFVDQSGRAPIARVFIFHRI